MRLVHLTDLHLSSLANVPLYSLWGKRWSGYGAWWKNPARKYLQRMLTTTLKAVRAENADQILVTGDLLQIGLKSEMAQALEWLPRLGSEEQVMLIPGNHDIYTRKSEVEIKRAWHDYLFHGTPGHGQETDFPVLRRLDGFDLIGLNSARSTPIFLAYGRLGETQLQALEGLLQSAAAAGRPVILSIHHPPLPGMTKWRVALRDAAELKSLLAAYPPLLIFHGHLHRNREQRWGDTRIYCTASPSSVEDASYRVIDIERQGDGWRVGMRLKTVDCDDALSFKTADEEHWHVPAAMQGPAGATGAGDG